MMEMLLAFLVKLLKASGQQRVNLVNTKPLSQTASKTTTKKAPRIKSPLKKPYKVNFKQHDVIQKMYENLANSDVKFLDGM